MSGEEAIRDMSRISRIFRSPALHRLVVPQRDVRERHDTRAATSCRSRLAARLRDTRGFMLAEQLVSVIFIGFLCVVVAAGLGAALSAYGSITTSSNASMVLSQAVQEVSDELSFSLSASPDGSFVSETTRAPATMDSDGSGIVMKSTTGTTVLIPSKNGLTPGFSSVPSYDASSNTWTFAITVKNGDAIVAEQAMTVGRVNPAGT